MTHPNLEMLRVAVKNLGELADEMVFVGGCTTGLLITDEGAAEVRATDDVDSIVEVASYGQYNTFAMKLKKIDFREDTREGAPTCRWVKGEIVLDVMPLDEKVLGFTNRWYEPAIETAEEREILPGVTIRVISSPYFCATKLEAFEGRGAGDYLASHDLEDIITVIDGRAVIIDEISRAPEDVRDYISGKIPQASTDAGEFAENIYDYAKAKDWAKAETKRAGLEKSVSELKAVKLDTPQLDETIGLIDKAIKEKNEIDARRESNRATFLIADITAQYNPKVPVEVTKLDFYGREIEIAAAEKDEAKLKQTAQMIRETWNADKPKIEAKGAGKVAAKFESLVAQAEKAASVADYTKVATPILDEVDNLEKVFE